MALFQNVVGRLRRLGKKDKADSQSLLNNEKTSKGAVDIPPGASELANDLFTTIIPKKGVEHLVLSQKDIPQEGLPEIERPSNTDQSDVEISTAEYIEMVGPVLEYLSPTRLSNFANNILDIEDPIVRAQAIRAASKYLDSFGPGDQSKLTKDAPKIMKSNPVAAVSKSQADAGGATTIMQPYLHKAKLEIIPENGIPAIVSSLAVGREQSSKPFEGDLPSDIGKLKVQLKKLRGYVPKFRKGELSSSAQLRLIGDIARQFPLAIERGRREQADLINFNQIYGAEQPYRQHSAAPPKQIDMKRGKPERSISNGPNAREALIKSRKVSEAHER